jgi:oxygen-independent coproporphyrinogen III oxidase
MNSQQQLIRKYNVPAPRYTSYPTVPYWDTEVPEQGRWLQVVKKAFEETNDQSGISLYLHLPFCESLCTYCGCNKRITKNHNVEESYIQTLVDEWQMYLDCFGRKPIIREIHLGGGTPTFFSAANLQRLIKALLKEAVLHPDYEFSFEGHPNNTTEAHLQTLYDLGFRRVSFGVQDFDLTVQRAINRIQPFEKVVEVTQAARRIGYESVNFDLIYGLPFQTLESVQDTIRKTGQLMPDRIAFYSYAHVPWKHPGQRGYSDADLPDNETKRELYESGKEMLAALGYYDIGMDHFALPQDPLYKALQNGTLHRNFMGYTTSSSELLIGLGTSAISDAKYAYMQNLKKVEAYKEQIAQANLAIVKGHFLTSEDLKIKKMILGLACQGVLYWNEQNRELLNGCMKMKLAEMEQEGLIELSEEKMQISPKGKVFVRNICMVFDKRHAEQENQSQQLFSKAI